ncbi:MAG: putative toxin-antitoxin system toxin component, PIN family, partial [Candidatus Omnitrophica bacterium]|nr:putative toxin-antitoxin system toxin component, PIN family [Candidatus Omnitrophota bacterium]
MGKKTKVVIDTNVLISAFGWHGKPEQIVKLATAGRVKNFISLEMLAELRNVVAYPKLNFSGTLQAEIIETVFSISSITAVNESVNVIAVDPPDNRVLECAVSANVDFIISGDKHLLNLKNLQYYKSANEAYSIGDYDRAVYMSVEALKAKSDYPEAIALVQSAAPLAYQSRIKRAADYEDRQDYDSAVSEYNAIERLIAAVFSVRKDISFADVSTK